MIDDKVKKLHGLHRATRPYPCGYCYYDLPDIIPITDDKNIVKGFKKGVNDDGSERWYYCDGGFCNGPDGYAECSRFAFDDRDYRPHHLADIYNQLDRYALSIISEAYEGKDEGIARSKIVDRGNKGYHTRNKRIDELKDAGFLDIYINNGKEYVRLTQTGNRIAEPIRALYKELMSIIEEGDILDDENVRRVFKAISDAPGIVLDDIIKAVGPNLDNAIHIHYLEEAGYIYSKYDESDWETLRFYTSSLGESVYKRGVKDVQKSKDDNN